MVKQERKCKKVKVAHNIEDLYSFCTIRNTHTFLQKLLFMQPDLCAIVIHLTLKKLSGNAF